MEERAKEVRNLLEEGGLGTVAVNEGELVGFISHQRISELQPEEITNN